MDDLTECVKIQPWSWCGLTLSAGNGVVSTAQLVDFARQAAAAFPDGVVHIDEYALRVYERQGEAPRIHFG
jgi:hypothetical protein